MIDALGRLGDRASLAVLERLTTLPGRSGVLARDGVAAINRGATLTAPEGGTVFRTRLVDARGEPLSGIWFTLALPDRRILGGLTDPSGEITVPGLPEGACALGLDRAP
jgi:hypothetical protein